VDEQGRTIIPKEVREALGLSDGGFVVYEVEGGKVAIRSVEWVPK
jgi:AbrB family looped-hinge helix DNA binding protein